MPPIASASINLPHPPPSLFRHCSRKSRCPPRLVRLRHSRQTNALAETMDRHHPSSLFLRILPGRLEGSHSPAGLRGVTLRDHAPTNPCGDRNCLLQQMAMHPADHAGPRSRPASDGPLPLERARVLLARLAASYTRSAGVSAG